MSTINLGDLLANLPFKSAGIGSKVPKPAAKGAAPVIMAPAAPVAAPPIAAPPVAVPAMGSPPLGVDAAPQIAPTGPPSVTMPMVSQKDMGVNFFDRARNTLNAHPDLRAALMRSGGATLTGGLGAGVTAGAKFMDDRRSDDIASRLKMRGLDISQQQADQTGDYQAGQLDIAAVKSATDIAREREAARHNRQGEVLTADGHRVQMRGQDVTRADTMDTNATSERNNVRSTDASRYGSDRSLEGTRYGADARSFDTGQTIAAGIGSKTAPPAAAAKGALPLPATEGDLEDGKYYRTANGVKQWSASQGQFF